MAKGKVIKKRHWAMIVYPESAPADWEDQLKQKGLSFCKSPLHDKDTNPDGTPKKAHYHVIICYSGPTSFSVVKAITDGLHQPIPQALEQVKGYYRYLTHKDNPEKYQYDSKDIVCHNFDIKDFVEMTKSEVGKIKREVTVLIREQDITEYADLIEYLIDNSMLDEWDVASNNTLYFDKYITSRRNSPNRLKNKPAKEDVLPIDVDPTTGEVIEPVAEQAEEQNSL